MARDEKTLESVLYGRGTIAFRDFARLLQALGFRLARIKGSHQIYVHPALNRPFPIQPDGKDAKAYQVDQLRTIICRHRLSLGANK